MTKQHSAHDGQLKSLERWRESELDVAQVEHAQKIDELTKNQQAVEAAVGVVDESQQLAREELTGNRLLSVDSLQRIRHFTEQKLGELKQAQDLLGVAERDAEEARGTVVAKLEGLAVVERLRARRATQQQRELERNGQKMLDEQALIRMANGNHIADFDKPEVDDHGN